MISPSAPAPIRPTLYQRGTGLLAREVSGVRQYYLHNGHCDVVQLADRAGNAVVRYDYDAFGNLAAPVTGDLNPFRYCGEYCDKGSETYYLRARYYNPRIGRFTSEDVAKDGINWYTYCDGNPIAFVDPTGKSEAPNGVYGFFAGLYRWLTDNSGGNKYDLSPTSDDSNWNSGNILAYEAMDFASTHDFVLDGSLSLTAPVNLPLPGAVGFPEVTAGYSHIYGNASGYEAGYVHVGVGGSVAPPILPGNIGFDVGIVENSPTPQAYTGPFYDWNVGASGFGYEYCEWPGGASASSITFSATNIIGTAGRLDYYWLVHETQYPQRNYTPEQYWRAYEEATNKR